MLLVSKKIDRFAWGSIDGGQSFLFLYLLSSWLIFHVMSKTPYATLETNVNSSSTSDKVMRIPPFAEASGLCAQKSRPPDACLPVSKTFAVR
jgi:hypothetical protein